MPCYSILFPFPLTTNDNHDNDDNNDTSLDSNHCVVIESSIAFLPNGDAAMPHLISPRGGAIPPRSKLLQGKCAEFTL